MLQRLTSCGVPSELALRLVGDPVDVVTGTCFDSVRDGIVASDTPMEWRRFHSSHRTDDRGLGPGWRHSFDHRLLLDLDGMRYDAPAGTTVRFPLLAQGERAAKRGYVLTRLGDRFELKLPDGPVLVFRITGALARLDAIGAFPKAIVAHYSTDGSLSGFTDSAGNRLAIIYHDGRIVAVQVQPRGGGARVDLVRYTYDRGYLVDAENAYHHHLRYLYDAQGRIVRRTDRRGYSFFFEFDREDRCIRSAGEDGVLAIALKYFPFDGRTEVTQADGGVWQYFYDTNKTITSIVDPSGAIRTFQPRGEDGQIGVEIDPVGSEIHYVYSEDGSLIEKHDAAGRPIHAPREYRIPKNAIQYELGRIGEREFELPAKPVNGSPTPELPELGAFRPPSIQANLDPILFSALTLASDPARGRTVEVRDVQGLLVREEREGRTRRYGYDPNGNRHWEIDFDGGKTQTTFASLNQPIEVADANGLIRRFGYAKDDEIISVSDPLDVRTEFWRDTGGRITGVRRGDTDKETYLRDLAGNLVEKRDARSRSLYSIKRGPQGEVLERAFVDGGFERYEYDNELRVVKADSPHGSVMLAYDWRDKRLCDQRDGKGVQRIFSGNELTEVSVLGRFVTSYEHRPWGRTREVVITDPTGREHRLRDVGDGVFQRKFANGFSETAQYHPAGHCVTKLVYPTRTPEERWERRYHYSGEGDLLTAEDSWRGRTRYDHDAGHRLVAEHTAGGATQHYKHDAAGNLLQNGPRSASYFRGNLLAEVAGRRFQHDTRHAIAAENWTGGSRRFIRDPRDQLIGISYYNQSTKDGRTEHVHAGTWTAKYDALNRRIEKSFGGKTTTFYWDGDRLMAEILPTGALRVYVYADDLAMTPVLFVDYESVDAAPKSGKVYAVFANHLGCPEAVQDMDGEWAWRARIEPYGLAHVEIGTDFHQPLRWPGHYFDSEVGLQYNRFRTYAPELGRYLEPDPLGRGGGLENVYQYTTNPLRRVDVQGLWVCPVTGKEIPDGGEMTKPDAETLARRNVQTYRAEIAGGLMSNNKAGPVLAAVVDRKTGKVYLGHNDPKKNPPKDLHPLLKDRVEARIRDPKAPDPGAHAEVYALNDALHARDAHNKEQNPNAPPLTEADLDQFTQVSEWRGGSGKKNMSPGADAPCCGNCKRITSGSDNRSGEAQDWSKDATGNWVPPP